MKLLTALAHPFATKLLNRVGISMGVNQHRYTTLGLGLAALTIPVLIHLIQRERKRVVEFPSLMFLRKIPYQSVRRRRIRDWFLLLMRLTALALIVLAFARPFFKRSELAAAA